jgi:hypothetical protein
LGSLSVLEWIRFISGDIMSKHMPEAPEANRSKKGPGDRHVAPGDTAKAKHSGDVNVAEQGDTANVMQNTTNRGFFRGRRMK